MSRSGMKIRSLFRKVLSYIYPPKCPVCNKVTGSVNEGILCGECISAFAEDFTVICPVCKKKPDECECTPNVSGNEWDHSPYTTVMPLIFSGYYTGYCESSVVSTLVYRMKRQKDLGAKLFFARILAETVMRFLTVTKTETDGLIVTYIPRSEAAFNKYGFDHMETVARRVSEMLGARFVRLLKRDGGVLQKELSGEERKANAYNTVSVDPAKAPLIHGSKILLIDDVITTGSTMRAAVSRLSLAGADTIIPAAVMISMTKNKNRNKKGNPFH